MSLNFVQFHGGVVLPALHDLEVGLMPFNDNVDRLITETIWHESDMLRALGQYPRNSISNLDPFGPGLGLASIEESTWDWMKSTKVGRTILDARYYQELVWDLRLNVVACRLRYYLDVRPVLWLSTIEKRAAFWQSVYNAGIVDRRGEYVKHALVIPWP